MQKLLSVIIPSYNSADFVETAIESVLFIGRSDVEIIVVNDGSTDNTKDVLKKYAGNKKVICENITNHGAGYARNYGVEKAQGKWIAFLDADDAFIYGTNLCEKLTDTADDVDVIYTPRAKTGFDLTGEVEILYPETEQEIANKIPRLEFWTCVYRSGFLKQNNIKFYEYRQQDIESAFRYLCYSKAKNTVIDNDLFFILQRVNLQSNTHTWNLHCLYRIKALVYFDLFEKTGFEEDKEFLFNVALDCLNKYFDFSAVNGIEGKKELKAVANIANKMKKYPYSFVPRKKLAGMKLTAVKLRIKNKRYAPVTKTRPENPRITNEEALNRLKGLKIV